MLAMTSELPGTRIESHAQAALDTAPNGARNTQKDLDELWAENALVPPSIDGCVHDLIIEAARLRPKAPAVCAWDGNFNYQQLDALSNKVAYRILQADARQGSVVPIFFEKSKWTPVAMLGVIKAGCAAVALDRNHPNARLISILQQLQPSVIISSALNRERASSLASMPIMCLDDEMLLNESTTPVKLPSVSSSDIVYISFTSGTTGVPKGACISHSNVCSAVHYQGNKLGFYQNSRVFDFAPYSFDVAWSNFLHTLCAGGCICIPSEKDVLDDLSSAITALEATLLNVTPTILRTISPVPSTLRTVLLSGEMPYQENITQWAGKVRLLNTYGPTECTFKCCFSVLKNSQEHRPDIGKGVGFCTWIVCLTDSNKLASIGSVGELYLEGPLVGQGYFSTPETTSAVFINNPMWLLAGSSRCAGRQGRLYKTGDLVRRKSNGDLLFVGRKDDAQLKIRGQRIEVGDVEHHVRACIANQFPIIADVVHPQSSDTSSLALFVETSGHKKADIQSSLNELGLKLSQVLPGFMIPSIYLPIDHLPIGPTGKIDRKKLRQTAHSLTWATMIEAQETILQPLERHQPVTEVERELQKIWAKILNLPIASISATDNFLRKGGDSVAAMQVVAAARASGMLLTVTEIFKATTLTELASWTSISTEPTNLQHIPPFSLLRNSVETTKICEEVSRLCGVSASQIEDIYPCTPLQRGMLAETSKDTGKYVSFVTYELAPGTELKRIANAWSSTVQSMPILRTRVVELAGEGLVQVVMEQFEQWHLGQSETSWGEQNIPMALGTPLCRARLVHGNPAFFVLEMHHAIFDGWSRTLLVDTLEEIYETRNIQQPLAPFQAFVKHIIATDNLSARNYWQSRLQNPEAIVYPSQNYLPGTKNDFFYNIQKLQWPQTHATPSSIVHSAVAVLLASYTNTSDVRFGTTVSGRQAAVPDVGRIAGPTIATVPFRLRFDWSDTVKDVQQQLQEHALEAIQYEQLGLSQIQRAGPNMADASQFQLLLVVQPNSQNRNRSKQGLLQQVSTHSSESAISQHGNMMGKYNSYAIMIVCQLTNSGAELTINYDSGAIEQIEVSRIALQLEHLLQQMCSADCNKLKVQDIVTPSKQDIKDIWGWNSHYPVPVREVVNEMIDRHALSRPEVTAIAGWDWQLNYQQLQNASSYIAYQLVERGVSQGSTVLLSLEKSAWMAVLLVAVLKIGAIALPISAKASVHNAHELVLTLQPQIAISSSPSESCPFQGLLPTFHVSEFAKAVQAANHCCQYSHKGASSDPAIILFTSGSTGASKGILWSHGTLSNNARALCETFGLSLSSRVFQFSDYEYDVSNIETLTTLSIGGCLCIPSDSDRSNRLAGAIDDMQATWMCLTPSVAETLNPADVPSLQVLVCAGELLQVKTASKWMTSHVSFYNWYGPAEAAVATSYLVREDTWLPGLIGHGDYCLNWLVNPRDPNVLAPIGTISELCIEGPILAAGYVGRDSKALDERAFLAPAWLNESSDTAAGYRRVVYKTGDLVKYRADGRLIFVSRSKDFERKLHGRRIDLNEIQNYVQQYLSRVVALKSVAEIFAPRNSDMETLALFVSPDIAEVFSEQGALTYIKETLPVDDLEAHLSTVLSENLIPRLYVPIAKVPINHAGKTNRRRLREIGSSLTYDELASLQPLRREMRQPSSFMEKKLQQLWATVMTIDSGVISADDSFFRLGGDSIGAMRLVAVARQHNVSLTVTDIFEHPKLASMAQVARQDSGREEEAIVPFSLLPANMEKEECTQYAARICRVPASDIVDMYPCTPLQEGLLAMTARKSGQYVSRSVLELQTGIEPQRLQEAWRATAKKLPILRTRIVDIPQKGLFQAILRSIPWRSSCDFASYMRDDEKDLMGLGTDLCRAAIIDRKLILTIHHCLYDGYVLKMILDELEAQYSGQKGLDVTPFQNFIRHVQDTDSEQAEEYWMSQLSGSDLTPFPSLPTPNVQPQADEHQEYDITLEWPRSGMTPSTVIRTAWAILAATYTSADKTVFGAVVSGRQVNLRGIESCPGPTISTVPIAISVTGDDTVRQLQERVQLQALNMMSYEHFGLQNIQRVTQHVISELFQTLLVVQPMAEGKSLVKDNSLFKARSFASNLETQGTDPFNIYALMVVCELKEAGLHLKLSFDRSIIESQQIARMAAQFENIMHQMCSDNVESLKVSDLQTASDSDVQFFVSENAVYPEEPQACVHDLVSKIAKAQPETIAVHAWDGQLSYRSLEKFSSTLCDRLISAGLEPGQVIVLYMEKTQWVPITQLAVLKAGGVFLLQSISTPEQRIKRIFEIVKPKFVLASESCMDKAVQYGPCYTVDEIMHKFPLPGNPVRPVKIQMSNPAAVLVTSGSTGEPKQILWSHKTLAANVLALGRGARYSETSRNFQFVSHNFDVCTDEMLATFVHGGCLCIPSESERLDNIATAINLYKCSHVNITPSAARSIDPQQVSYLTTILLCGENVEKADIDRWKHKCHLINWYGPAECSMASFYDISDKDVFNNGTIGRSNSSFSARCWLVSPKNHDILVPFGAIGEIALEGPSCAVGYLGDEELTARSFHRNPRFLSFRSTQKPPQESSIIYCTGDLARYEPSGNLVYLGRSSNLFKVRGQLIDPGEVEYHIKQCIVSGDDVKVLVELISLPGQNTDTLVAFVSLGPSAETNSEEVMKLTEGINERLKAHLPHASIPSYYIPLQDVPLTSTGKRDRKILKKIGASFHPLPHRSHVWQQPSTIAERSLRDLWSQILSRNADTISARDSFLQVGDSIQAMRLVALAQRQGLRLSVADIFQNPTLEDMARQLRDEDNRADITIEPFSLMPSSQKIAQIRHDAASLCGLHEDEIEDVFPCTPLQGGLLALTAKQQDEYVSRDVLEVAPTTDIDHFKSAWEAVVEKAPILRTRIIDLPEHGLVQVVAKGVMDWTPAGSIDEYLTADKKLPMDLGSSLSRYGLVRKKDPGASSSTSWCFMLTLHHSIYDGLTMSLIIEMLENIYNGQMPLQLSPFQSFVRQITLQDKDEEAQYWKRQFSGLEAPQFPTLPFVTYQPKADSAKVHWIEDIQWRTDNYTPSTLIRSTWALLCSRYTNSPDVVFGTLVSGRKAPVVGIDRVAGPTISTVPVRLQLDDARRVDEFLGDVQTQSIDMIQYEHTGISNIRRFSDEAQQACRFQTVLVTQPPEQALRDSKLFISRRQADKPEDTYDRYRHFNSYALLIVCTPQGDRLKIEVSFDSSVIKKESVDILVSQFDQVLKYICKPLSNTSKLSEVDMMTADELDQIWQWNAEAPSSVELCIHDLITKTAQAQPSAVAISAWDGELTYQQLDEYSDSLAREMIRFGVQPRTIVPLCFDKSLWTVIAFLGVIKAGAAVLLLDTTQPELRLKSLMLQVMPSVIVSATSQQNLASKLGDRVMTIEADFDHFGAGQEPGHDHTPLPTVLPTDLLYVNFTSGSTGQPKGCMLTHQNWSSAVSHQKGILKWNKDTRIYDFSSYAFDAVHWCLFHVLVAGGTVCVPSEEDRRNNLQTSMQKFGTTDVFLTPSTARLVDPSMIPTLLNIYIGGEVITKDDLAPWMACANATITYGPTECSAITLYWNVPRPMLQTLSIGNGVGVATWIVDHMSGTRLAPIGTIGELYLEGPLVGQGYLENPEATASAFLQDPLWLTRSRKSHGREGRSGRVYRTGDLVKYDPADGTILFVGRRDTQVKLRGQRIELSEVEFHVRDSLRTRGEEFQVIAEIIRPESFEKPMLVVFIQCGQSVFEATIHDLKAALPERLPSFMVPAAFIAIEDIPLTAGGKIDRNRLRDMGSRLTHESFMNEATRGAGDPPTTELGYRLQKMWEDVLGRRSDTTVGLSSNFLRLGGDSISAMQLAASARNQGLSLTVRDILSKPLFSEMVETITISHPIHKETAVKPFALLQSSHSRESVVASVVEQCHIGIDEIEDVFPCTGVQKSLISVTAKRPGDYIATFRLNLRKDIDLVRFKQAWENVSQLTAPILRTRIVDIPGEGLVQVQLRGSIVWESSPSITAYLEKVQSETTLLGRPLTRFGIILDPTTHEMCYMFTQHHAVYDGHSLDLLITEVSKAYAQIIDHTPVAPFQAFFKHIQSMDRQKANAFWQRQLSEAEATPFPSLPSQDYQPQADSTVRRNLEGFKWPNCDVTASTFLRVAWSILSSRYTDSNDVIFGAITSGRQAAVTGIERMVAPLISALPIRIKIDPQRSVKEFLDQVQRQSIEMIDYEHTELLDIRRMSPDLTRASHFNSLLIVQPARAEATFEHDNGPFLYPPLLTATSTELDRFNPHAVMIMCELQTSDSLAIEINFDSNVIDTLQMSRILEQFVHILNQLVASSSGKVDDIQVVTQRDCNDILEWNSALPESVEKCVHDMISETARKQPQAQALCAWNGSLTYEDLGIISDNIASHLLELGAGAGTIVPLYFEKSLWMPVAALGAMKAGAACLAIDTTQPEARIRSIMTQVRPKVVLSSATSQKLASQVSNADVVIVDSEQFMKSCSDPSSVQLANVHPTDILYVVFTSGSTGTPKGIMTTHGNFASASTHQSDALHISRGSRVFDFVSYSFDVAWSNVLSTLIQGGCLCIPSESERKNDIIGSFHRLKADYAYFTPSVARSLEPSMITGLKTLAMGGESIRRSDVSRWTQVDTIIGIYGPAECAQLLTIVSLKANPRSNQAGIPFGARVWLVEPSHIDRIAAIGAVGELVVEGPIVSIGYLGDAEKSSIAYIDPPMWSLDNSSAPLGRKFKFYKTGDLLRYQSDGSLEFIGRKDTMIKLRGQRVELEEVEFHVRSSIQNSSLYDGIAAEIIVPRNTNDPILSLFISVSKTTGNGESEDRESKIMQIIDGLESKLGDVLPQYMVPSVYIQVQLIPMTTTNKIDRRALRELGNAQSMEQLAKMDLRGNNGRAPSTAIETRLQKLWSSVLDIEPSSIHADSHFLRIGGESIAAMRMILLARKENLQFTVADIFKAPRLSQLAKLVMETDTGEDSQFPAQLRPFCLLQTEDVTTFIKKHVSPLLDIEAGLIEDVVPATSFQKRAVLDALQHPPSRLPQFIIDLPQDVDFLRLRRACLQLLKHFDTLRTIFVEAEGRFWQVYVADLALDVFESIDLNQSDGSGTLTNTICERDLKRPRQMGQSLVRFIAVQHYEGNHKLIFRLSHAQFDGFCLGMLFDTLSSIYQSENLLTPPSASFRQVITLNESRKDESLCYWTSRLRGCSFPTWSTSDPSDRAYSTSDRLTVKMTIDMPILKRQTHDYSAATVFHAACALILSQYFNQTEIVFGRLVLGRTTLPAHLQNVVGPCLTEVPIRVTISAGETVTSIASRLQHQFIEDSRHEAAGMDDIIQHCTDWGSTAADFGWRTAFQQEDEQQIEHSDGGSASTDGGFQFAGSPSRISHYDHEMLPRTRPEIYATPRKGGSQWDLEFEGNRRLIDEVTVREILGRLSQALMQYSAGVEQS